RALGLGPDHPTTPPNQHHHRSCLDPPEISPPLSRSIPVSPASPTARAGGVPVASTETRSSKHLIRVVCSGSRIMNDALPIPLPPSPATYSPSQVTSPQSDEPGPRADPDDPEVDHRYDSLGLAEPPPPPLTESSLAVAETRPDSPVKRPDTPPMDYAAPKSVLGFKGAKQRLQAFKASKAGNVSFGMSKANLKLKANTSFDETEKPAHARKAKEGPAKMNIDSIMEEENLEKAKSLPNKFLEDRRKQVERALNNIAIPIPMSPQVIEKPLSQIDSITATGVDTFGFATASRPLVQEKSQKSPSRRESRRSRSRERKRRRRRSRSRSRSPEARKPKVDTRGLKAMPSTWQGCKEASLSILEPEFFRIQRELLDPETRKKLRTQKLGQKLFVKPAEDVLEGFERDCEWALRGTQGKHDTTEVEFPQAGVRQCQYKGQGKDDPVITWSQNPKWDLFVKTRQEVVAESSETEAALMSEFWNPTSVSECSSVLSVEKPHEIRTWFPKESVFLEMSSGHADEAIGQFDKFLECFDVGAFPVKEKEKTKKKRGRKEMEQELEELEKIMEAKEEELDLAKKKRKKKRRKDDMEAPDTPEAKLDKSEQKDEAMEDPATLPKKKKKHKTKEEDEFEDFTPDESESEVKIKKKKKKRKKKSSRKDSEEECDPKPRLKSPAKLAQDNPFASRLMSMAGYLGDSGSESKNESQENKSNSSRMSESKSKRRHPSDRSPLAQAVGERLRSPSLELPTDPRLRKRKSGPRTPSPVPQTETHLDHRRSSNERPRSPNSSMSDSDLRKRRHARTPPLPPSSDRSPSPSPPPPRRRPLSPDCISETSLRSPINFNLEREFPENPGRGRGSSPGGGQYGRRGFSPRGRGSSPPPRRPPASPGRRPPEFERRPPSPLEHDRWRPPSPGAGRRESYRFRDGSSPRRYGRGGSPSPPPRSRYSRSPSPRRRRSPPSGYNGRVYSPDRRRAGRSPSPRFYHHRGRGSSPYRSPRDEYHYRRTSDGHYRSERSIPDSTISDADLLASHRSAPLLALPNSSDLKADSPKRLSLDERLEKELGISVRKDPLPHIDYTKPPPGYAPVDVRTTAGSAQYHATKHPHQPSANPVNRSIPAYPPQQAQPPPPPVSAGPTLSALPTATLLPAKMPSIKTSRFEVPVDDNRLVQIGNMVQIVPEEKKQQLEQQPPTNVGAVPLPSEGGSAAKVDANPALNMNKKIEEMTKRKEAERRMRREQRAAERLQQQRDSNVVPETPVEAEVKKSSGKRILETLEKEEDQEAKEAQLLKEAISTVPDLDEDPGTRAIAVEEEEDDDPQAMTLKAMKKIQKAKKKQMEQVTYISLKPLTKKERKRQQRLLLSGAMEEALGDLEGAGEDENDEEEEEEEFVKPEPVALPDASTCKPILNHFGSINKKPKKVLKYADGVLPGQGSPDQISEDEDAKSKTVIADAKCKRRKKIRVKVVRTRLIDGSSSEEDGPPPPPPPGSPPLHTTAYILKHFAWKAPSPAKA
ncbi:hypothetical protein TCAL_04947, partial [Tigriopus californicus]